MCGVNNEGFAVAVRLSQIINTGDYSRGSDIPVTNTSLHNCYFTDFKWTVGVIYLQKYSDIQRNSRLILGSATFQTFYSKFNYLKMWTLVGVRNGLF